MLQGMRRLPVLGSHSSPLRVYTDAVLLWSGTMAATLLGFVFWAIVARLYATEDVGRASALIAAIMLIGSAGNGGIGFTLVRFRQADPADRIHLINWCTTAALGLTAVLALLFAGVSPLVSPEQSFLLSHPLELAAFVAFCCAASLQLPQVQLLLAENRPEFGILANVIAGVTKVMGAAALYSVFEAMGMVIGYGIASWLALAFTALIIRRVLPGFRPALTLSRPPATEMIRFSVANHLGWLAYNLPTYLMPIAILNLHGERASAYFYVAWMLGSLAASMPASLGQALFSRGSERTLSGLETWRAFAAALGIAGVFALFFLVFSSRLLQLFGSEYAEASASLLRWVAIAGIPSSFVAVYYGILRIAKANTELIILTSLSSSTTIILGTYLASTSLGIAGAGIAYLTGQSAVAAICAVRLLRGSRQGGETASTDEDMLAAVVEQPGLIT